VPDMDKIESGLFCIKLLAADLSSGNAAVFAGLLAARQRTSNWHPGAASRLDGGEWWSPLCAEFPE